jgi:hypothetical protein
VQLGEHGRERRIDGQHLDIDPIICGVSSGIDRLRAKRGRQRVSFDDVADHLVDYAERHPDTAATLDALAGFLADVEDVHHDHDADPERGVPPEAEP